MFRKALSAYKLFIFLSLLMTSLMLASSLLQPLYLKDVLNALLAGNRQEIYRLGHGCWALVWLACSLAGQM